MLANEGTVLDPPESLTYTEPRQELLLGTGEPKRFRSCSEQKLLPRVSE